jgi:hypothetical protein
VYAVLFSTAVSTGLSRKFVPLWMARSFHCPPSLMAVAVQRPRHVEAPPVGHLVELFRRSPRDCEGAGVDLRQLVASASIVTFFKRRTLRVKSPS